MPRTVITLTLSDARRMLEAGEAKAASLGIPYNIAVVDVGGALIAFARQDGALEGSIDLAIGGHYGGVGLIGDHQRTAYGGSLPAILPSGDGR